MTNSSIVEKNFSRDPDYYHLHAETQLYVAEKLAELISCKVQKPTGVLEIGCGTGFLTSKLFQLFPCAEFTISDISPTMLQFCKKQIQPLQKQQNIVAKFAENDISDTCPKGKFDLIVSSLALQWVPQLAELLQQLKKHLNPNGQLIFSTLSVGTFAAVKTVFKNEGIAFPGPELLVPEEIQKAGNCFDTVHITNETRTEEFSSMMAFLRHIQRTGAGNATGQPLAATQLKKILEAAKMISAEYNITYAVCQ